MAKSKASNSARQQSAASAKRKAAATADIGRSATVKKSSVLRTQPAIAADEIGRVAGDVWSLLNRDGGQTLSAIKKSVDAPADIVVAAIGWLAREDKLEFLVSGRAVTVSLR